MRIKLRILFLIYSISLFSQEKKELFFYDQCRKITVQSEYLISEEHKIDFNKKSNNFKFKFKKNKHYLIRPTKYNPLENYFLYLNDSEKQNDTILISNIYIKTDNPSVINNPKFYNCGTLCNGQMVSYYPNGKIEKTGIYDKGELLSEKYYHLSGKLNFENEYSKNDYGFFIKHIQYEKSKKQIFYIKEKASYFVYRKKVNKIKVTMDSIKLSEVLKYSHENIKYWIEKPIKKDSDFYDYVNQKKCFVIKKDTISFLEKFDRQQQICFLKNNKFEIIRHVYGWCDANRPPISKKGKYKVKGTKFIFRLKGRFPQYSKFKYFGRKSSYLWKKDEGIFVKIKKRRLTRY